VSALELAPEGDSAVKCAEFSRQIGLDPGGSALAVDEIIVADVALPWPKPVFAREDLQAVPGWTTTAKASGRRVRVLAAVPLAGEAGRVVVHSRAQVGAAHLDRVEHRVGPDEVPGLIEALLLHGLEASPDTQVETDPPAQELLICTQGSHDRCCGSIGTRFVQAIESARPGLSVRRVSHTGGHRFAPTGMSLPDGRMWGLFEVDEMISILDRSVRPSRVAHLCRGWTGADEGPPQMAERAILGLVDDWSFDTQVRQVDVIAEDDGTTTVLVGAGDKQWEVRVAIGREVPTIACGEPGGLPIKPGLEYQIAGIRAIG
jgi:hypothetical protein